MLYYLFTWLDKHYDIPGAGLFQFISFRTGMAVILSLLLTTVYGSRLIRILRAKQVGETVRNLGLDGQIQKQGTPTMGGLIILLGILAPTLLFARIDNIYIILMLITTVWMGAIGFVDDYIKVFKKDKEGLAGRFKIMGQVGLALIIGWTMYFHPDIVVREQVTLPAKVQSSLMFINVAINFIILRISSRPLPMCLFTRIMNSIMPKFLLFLAISMKSIL